MRMKESLFTVLIVLLFVDSTLLVADKEKKVDPIFGGESIEEENNDGIEIIEVFNGKNLEGWDPGQGKDEWMVKDRCIVFQGSPLGIHQRLKCPVSWADSFIIQIDVKANNMQYWGFQMGNGKTWKVTRPPNKWQRLRVIVARNQQYFTVNGRYKPRQAGEVRRRSGFCLSASLTKNSKVHTAWFKNIKVANISDEFAEELIHRAKDKKKRRK